MTWKVFAGEESETYAALVSHRAHVDGFGRDLAGRSKCLRAHLHRGLAYLASGKETRSLADFVERWSP